MKNRVVITGLGVISSIGMGRDDFWESLIAGKNGISKVSIFDTTQYEAKNGGEVKNFVPTNYMPDELLRNFGRGSQFAIAATKLALEDSRLKFYDVSRSRKAIIIGTTMGEIGMLEEIDKHWSIKGEEEVWALTISKFPVNAISDNVNRYINLSGGLSCILPTACSAGNYSVGYGFDLIRNDKVDYVIAGGVDPFSRIAFTGFNRLYAMAPDLCRPFDKNREGMILGEGAGILILEKLESALKRNTPIYAEILGYGLSCDAKHMTNPSVEGMETVLRRALLNSMIDLCEVDYICAHGTGTLANDKTECSAIKNVFGKFSKTIPVSSIKSMLGHTMGAASAIEAIACSLAIVNNILPPTMNFTTPDPDCDIDCVPNRARENEINVVLNNSFAFGGNNACLVLKRFRS